MHSVVHLIVFCDKGFFVLVVLGSILGFETSLGQCFRRRVVDTHTASAAAAVDDLGGVEFGQIVLLHASNASVSIRKVL